MGGVYVMFSSSEPAPGYVIRDLLPEHMRLVAENWNLKDWFTEFTPLEAKIKYLKELCLRFDAIGMFLADNPMAQPLSWAFRKTGMCAYEYWNQPSLQFQVNCIA